MITNNTNSYPDQVNELQGKLYEAHFHLKMNANWINHLHGENENLKNQIRLSESKCGRCSRLEIELASQNMAFSLLQRDYQTLQHQFHELKQSTPPSKCDLFNSSVRSFAGSSTSLFPPSLSNNISKLPSAISTESLHKPTPPDPEKKRKILEKAREMERRLNLIKTDENENEISETCSNFRVFVGHLQATHTEQVLMKYFSKFGHVVDVYIPVDAEKRARGFAYVSFSELKNENALKNANHTVEGKKIYVDISDPSKYDTNVTKTLLVSGLIQDVPHEVIKKYFDQFGKVVEIIRHRESRRRYLRWAFVHFDSEQSSRKAMERKEHKLNGNIVDIRYARDFAPEKVHSKNSLNVKKLLISNLNPKTNSVSLKSYFEKFGTVHDAYIPNFYGKKESKCYGYIVINDDVQLNPYGHQIDGYPVSIEQDNPSRFKDKSTTLLVSASPETMEKIPEHCLRDTFKKFGNILSIRKPNDPRLKKSAHYAFVEFDSPHAVEEAIKKFAFKINGNLICVTKARHDQKK